MKALEPATGDAHGATDEVDVALIDEMLKMTPEQRLRLNDQIISTIEELRASFRRLRDDSR